MIKLFLSTIRRISMVSKIPQKTRRERMVDWNTEASQIINIAESPRNISDNKEIDITPNRT